MAADFSIDDVPAALSDLARRWRVSKRRVQYAATSRDVAPSAVAGGMALFDATGQEEIAKALEEIEADPRGWRRKVSA